ncbi:hypothetical protein GDO78_018446 [Eleutherodactylus coqui]|uniref:Uncharacterized protein n=1 Tax=Eleutherodactylus coqui TaxID=57060 RepID=A0A8J6C2H4_ELECQ|nr:hypothetical protein GDO78_018446 [Eleutherodactylus coqui]
MANDVFTSSMKWPGNSASACVLYTSVPVLFSRAPLVLPICSILHRTSIMMADCRPCHQSGQETTIDFPYYGLMVTGLSAVSTIVRMSPSLTHCV